MNLYEYLRQKFAGDPNVQVVLDHSPRFRATAAAIAAKVGAVAEVAPEG